MIKINWYNDTKSDDQEFCSYFFYKNLLLFCHLFKKNEAYLKRIRKKILKMFKMRTLLFRGNKTINVIEGVFCPQKGNRIRRKLSSQKQSPRRVLREKCSEKMQQIYRRTPMSKCDFNKVAKQIGYLIRQPWGASVGTQTR